MRNSINKTLTLLLTLTSLATTACDPDATYIDDVDTTDDTGTEGEDTPRAWTARPLNPLPAIIPVGAQWGPCDLSGVNDPDWWGCDGEPGEGLACARPVSNGLNLNICVPQTWDPAVDDNCLGLTAPFGDGVRLQGSAYCVVDCQVDADCAGGMACSSSHLCAWKG